MTKKNKILIATGGTGGHVFPAYSLASYFMDQKHNVKLTTDNRGFSFLKDYKNLHLIKLI
jgi:UDP-N-acetylglucosamine--N-acetylmuramyl-(pentapeptide) pyrophosphoryl-undecaprenol N-acetylglucosamine transferase